jgi:AraC-like DNA-binding protein
LQAVTTIQRLLRTTVDFVALATPDRRLLPERPGVEHALRVVADGWSEASMGDPMHKLVLVRSGALDLEGASGGWLILPGHMVFIPAERAFALQTGSATCLEVVHFDPACTPWHHHGCWVTGATPLATNLIERALEWDVEEVTGEALAHHLFRTLALLCRELFSGPRMLWLPAAKSPEMRAVVRYLSAYLAEATVKDAADAAGISARTLQRRCVDEFQMSWRGFLREARMTRALELLVQGHPVGSIARAIGFESVSAFTVAFSQRFGTPPSGYVTYAKPTCTGSLGQDGCLDRKT